MPLHFQHFIQLNTFLKIVTRLFLLQYCPKTGRLTLLDNWSTVVWLLLTCKQSKDSHTHNESKSCELGWHKWLFCELTQNIFHRHSRRCHCNATKTNKVWFFDAHLLSPIDAVENILPFTTGESGSFKAVKWEKYFAAGKWLVQNWWQSTLNKILMSLIS